MNDRLFVPLDPARLRVTVAMATYNGARFINEQLDSIANQTRQPDELVISDDGSTDNTLALVARFAEHAPFPVRILEKPVRLGFADNFLHAAEQSDGDVVAFCDQDDVWNARKLEIGLARLVADNSLLSLHRLTVTDEALRPVSIHTQGIASDAVFAPLALDPQAGWGNTMMLRRGLTLLIPRGDRPPHPGLDRALSHDTWLYLLAAALGRVSQIAEPLILYRQHDANAAGVTTSSRAARIADLRVDPVAGFRRKQSLDVALSALLAALAARTSGELRARASAAAIVLATRVKVLDARVALHRHPSLLGRSAAYATMLGSLRHDPAGRARAPMIAAKDLALGVFGLAGCLRGKAYRRAASRE